MTTYLVRSTVPLDIKIEVDDDTGQVDIVRVVVIDEADIVPETFDRLDRFGIPAAQLPEAVIQALDEADWPAWEFGW